MSHSKVTDLVVQSGLVKMPVQQYGLYSGSMPT